MVFMIKKTKSVFSYQPTCRQKKGLAESALEFYRGSSKRKKSIFVNIGEIRKKMLRH